MVLGPVRDSETLPHPTSPSFPHSSPRPILHSSQVETLGGWDGAPEALGLAVSLPELQAPLSPATLQGSGASSSSPSRAWVLLSCPWGVGSCGHPQPVGRLRTDPQLEEVGQSPQGPHLRLTRGHR